MGGHLHIFDRHGRPKVEIETDFHCQWVLNDYGRADFEISLKDDKARERNLRFGNFVLFEHSDLPRWAGYIWPPRQWRAGKITVNAVGAEHAFGRGIVDRRGKLIGTTKNVFEDVVDMMAEQLELPIVAGDIVGQSKTHRIDMRSQSFRTVIDEIIDAEEQRWWFGPERDSERNLFFEARLKGAPGKARNYALVEGKNFEVGPGGANEEGDLINAVRGLGEKRQGTWPFIEDENRQSINLYGKTFAALSVEADSEGQVERAVDKMLEEEAWPFWSFTATVYGQSALAHMRVGDRYNMQLNSIGFFENANTLGQRLWVQAISMEYKQSANVLMVVFAQTDEPEVVE